jgi:hypothetical protein
LGSKTFVLASPTTTLCCAAETTEARTEAEATNVVKKRMVIFLSKRADLEGMQKIDGAGDNKDEN